METGLVNATKFSVIFLFKIASSYVKYYFCLFNHGMSFLKEVKFTIEKI